MSALRDLADALDAPPQAGGAALARAGETVVSVVRTSTPGWPEALARAERRRSAIVLHVDEAVDGGVRSGWRGPSGAPLVALVDQGVEIPTAWDDGGPDYVVSIGSERRASDAIAVDTQSASSIVDDVVSLFSALSKREPASSAKLVDLVPFDIDGPYDMHKVLDAILDAPGLVSIDRPASPAVLAGLGSLRGRRVGVLASCPDIDGGRLDAAACRKIRRFCGIVGALGLPLVTFVDTAGESWEEPAFPFELGRALDAQFELGTPTFAVIVGRAVGAAAALLGAVAVRADMVFAWPRAHVMATPEGSPLAEAAGVTSGLTQASVLHGARAATVSDLLQPHRTRDVLSDLLSTIDEEERA